MRTIHISMTSKFQCEYCQCFTFKRCDKLKLKCTSHGVLYSTHYFGKISINVKTVNVVMQIFDRFVGYVCLKILRCWRTISRPCHIQIPNSLQKLTLKGHFVENVFVLKTFYSWLLYEPKFGLYRKHIISPCEMSVQMF